MAGSYRKGLSVCFATMLGAMGMLAPSAASGAMASVALSSAPPVAAAGAKVRTPGRIEVLIARDLAGGGPDAVLVSEPDAVRGAREGVWLGVWPDGQAVPADVRRVSLDYAVGPMAIMRTDTDIRDWKDLSGRTVCMDGNGRYVGEVAARFGAIEQIYPSATDALLAVRTGLCDATVQDDRFLHALLKFPEWKKFSADLPAYRHMDLVWATGAGDAYEDWALRMQSHASVRIDAMTAQQARDIAFEVYLDQAVPDCH
ncbi:MAG: ABC transporter substrate-binding protein [Alcaligenaceae bacterium]|nr:ABC transporter substrate-binding protein [Alcaligenaceae bacterium]